MAEEEIRIKVSRNGPYLVTGGLPIRRQIIGANAQGESTEWIEGETLEPRARYALCRCGHSQRKPFCDGTHARIGFDGTETASRVPHQAQARVFDGPVLSLADVPSLCASARFCSPNGTVWKQVEHTDDPDVRAQFERQVRHCPAGRLVALSSTTDQPIESDLPKSIGLVEDPEKGTSGPLWVQGGIEVVSADGEAYEVRNQQTLCRCGASANKPFCDGKHISIGFRDEGYVAQVRPV
jgi:CDGSH-type Zn-finger protein